jgi:hypothetical protein
MTDGDPADSVSRDISYSAVLYLLFFSIPSLFTYLPGRKITGITVDSACAHGVDGGARPQKLIFFPNGSIFQQIFMAPLN